MSGWTKLFSSIVTSSVWCEDHATVRVWVAMLATADANGVVEGSLPGFAHLARVTLPEMRTAVDKLSSPDPDSRTPDHEGRRIEKVAGGWRLLNYGAYRERGQEKEGSRAPYMRRYRQKIAAQDQTVTRNATKHQTVTRNTEERGEKREASQSQQQPRAGDRVRPPEEVEALRANIAELAELLGVDFDRCAIAVTSGGAVGRKVCKGTLSFETMSDKHFRRSLLDSNTAIAREQARRRDGC